MTTGDLGAVELNQAFAAQAIVVMWRLKLDEDRVNGYGGAIALGHPLGCSGARLVVTLMGRMERGHGAGSPAELPGDAAPNCPVSRPTCSRRSGRGA